MSQAWQSLCPDAGCGILASLENPRGAYTWRLPGVLAWLRDMGGFAALLDYCASGGDEELIDLTKEAEEVDDEEAENWPPKAPPRPPDHPPSPPSKAVDYQDPQCIVLADGSVRCVTLPARAARVPLVCPCSDPLSVGAH